MDFEKFYNPAIFKKALDSIIFLKENGDMMLRLHGLNSKGSQDMLRFLGSAFRDVLLIRPYRVSPLLNNVFAHFRGYKALDVPE